MGSLSFCGEKAIPKSLMADSHHYMRSHFFQRRSIWHMMFTLESYFMSLPIVGLGN